jgi:hypothetical protein
MDKIEDNKPPRRKGRIILVIITVVVIIISSLICLDWYDHQITFDYYYEGQVEYPMIEGNFDGIGARMAKYPSIILEGSSTDILTGVSPPLTEKTYWLSVNYSEFGSTLVTIGAILPGDSFYMIMTRTVSFEHNLGREKVKKDNQVAFDQDFQYFKLLFEKEFNITSQPPVIYVTAEHTLPFNLSTLIIASIIAYIITGLVYKKKGKPHQ